MKKISIVIVNYNVAHFLEQALKSVQKATANIDAEIFVVDNNSVDGSVEMIQEKFPEVILIANKENLGFSKANNQAMRKATGEYILLLNPDTVIEEQTLEKCCRFMDDHPDAGGLGVKMVDGKGKFLPESKRSLPTPWVAFSKVFGLAAIFPKSKKFGRYHLKYLDENKTHEIEILAGAFMLMRKKVLDEVGLLDEEYFMYGEDIDLSYRIIKGGYKNYYFPETKIIHYKGESTKRTSVNYVFIFYKAMIIFAKKHFSKGAAKSFSFLINIAIYLRALVALTRRLGTNALLPVIDFTVAYVGYYFLKGYWETNHKYVPTPYPDTYMEVVVPIYILVWIFCVFMLGGYDRPFKSSKIVQGIVLGSLIISAFTNFFDDLRYSKALIILGSSFSIIAFISNRLAFHFAKYKNFNLGKETIKRIAIVGDRIESKRVIQLLSATNQNLEIIGFISPTASQIQDDLLLGKIHQINEIAQIYDVSEIIFCSKDIAAHQIIELMSSIDKKHIEFKIVPDESNYVIGSSSSTKNGDLYTVDIELSITKSTHIRSKRLFDMISAFAFLVLSPLLIFVVKKPIGFFRNTFKVLLGKKSWVGFKQPEKINISKVKPGIFNAATLIDKEELSSLDESAVHRLDMLYAKDYNVATDLDIVLKNIRQLGR